jgi:hypothetical protein
LLHYLAVTPSTMRVDDVGLAQTTEVLAKLGDDE